MPRGGDHGGGRPKVLSSIVKKSFILTPETAAILRALADHFGCSESEAIRRVLQAQASVTAAF